MGRATDTVEKYLHSPVTERHEVVSAVWDVINEASPNGCVEGIASDMTITSKVAATLGYLCLHDWNQEVRSATGQC
jgi:hypothetical protein